MSTLLCCFCRSISLSLCVFYSLFFTVSLFLLSLSLNQFYRTPNALKFYLVIKIKQLKMTFFCVCVWSIWSFFRSWFSFSFRHIICLFFRFSMFYQVLIVICMLVFFWTKELLCVCAYCMNSVLILILIFCAWCFDYVCCWLLFRWGRIKEVFFSSNTVIFFRLGMWCEQEFQNDRANFQ